MSVAALNCNAVPEVGQKRSTPISSVQPSASCYPQALTTAVLAPAALARVPNASDTTMARVPHFAQSMIPISPSPALPGVLYRYRSAEASGSLTAVLAFSRKSGRRFEGET
jgi:hypothetical protein